MLLYELSKDEMRSKCAHCSIHFTMRNFYHFVTYSGLSILLWTSQIVILYNCSPSFGCPSEEYEALLELRSSLLYNNYTSPPTWRRGRDCCLWERVACNSRKQQVSKLNLSYLGDYEFKYWRLNFSIFSSFQELRQLDLSYNQIIGPLSQMDISGLRKLEILSLAENMLTGSIPLSFKNLSSLSTLDLRANMLNVTLDVEGLQGLQKLRVLDLGFNQLTGGIPIALGNLSSLNLLHLDGNDLTGSVHSQVFNKLQNLRELDLSYNQLNGSLPSSLGKLVSLQHLDLSDNIMEGNIPPHIFAGLVSLQHLDISNNIFDGHFSFFSFANLSKLEFIKFSNNEELFIHLDSGKFVPPFQLRFLLLSHCNLDANTLATPAFLVSQYKLEALDLSHSNLTGHFPYWLFEKLTRLEILNLRNNSIIGEFQLPEHLNTSMNVVDLSMNLLSGSIPTDIGTIFPYMVVLHLSSNHLTGNIPSSLCNMSYLAWLDLSDNNLSGEVPNRLMIDCTKLVLLKLSNNNLHGKLLGTNHSHQASFSHISLDGNNFTGTLPSNLSGYQQLFILDVHNNQLSGIIPESIGNVFYLEILNLAGNHFHGQIPHHICNSTFLYMLDLSSNNFSGSLPRCFQSSEPALLNFAGNALIGKIPSSFFNISSLKALDVSNNQLSGELPRQIGDHMLLEILVLGGNSLEGPIQIELCKLQSLHVLDLSQNNLSGSIPSCFGKMHFRKTETANLYHLYFGGGVSYYSWPFQMNVEVDFYVIISVDLISKGHLYPYRTDHLFMMSAIDLSANKLTGNIPSKIGNLDELVQLNLSHNRLTGPIPETFSKLDQIESLDISYNQLSGVIPWQLTQLTSLEVFSVAYNNLSGCTPDFKNQFGTFNMSSYEGNIGLHGPPLEKTCTSDSNPIVEVEENQDDSSVDDVIFFAILAASFVIGFWGCIAFLLFHHSGQHIHSILDGYVDSLTERFLMVAHKWTRMQRNHK